ncbi:MAG: CoA transferase, partial [Acidimicrobiia bacterium]
WVFLAASSDGEWRDLVAALAPYGDLGGDIRFADASSRNDNADVLVEALSAIFVTRTKADWERDLLAADVACVEVTTVSIEEMMWSDEFGRAGDYLVDVVHPVFEDHPRLAPLVRFSRSATQALPGVLAGSATDTLLTEIGYSAEKIAALRAADVVR